MTALELLESLQQNGIELTAAGDKLRYRPKSAVPPELVEVMRSHKAELLALINARDWQLGDPIEWDAEPEPIDCEKCQRFDCWWDATGRRRCLTCDPPTASRRWLAICEKIRAKRRKGRP